MDKEEYERRQEELARHAESEGAWYYDPDSPTLWKRFILGPVPLWRRFWWSIFPPSFQTLMQMQRRSGDKMLEEAFAPLRSPKRLARTILAETGKGLRQTQFDARAQANELEWLDELVREHKAGTRDNSDYIRRLIRSIEEEHKPSAPLTAQLQRARSVLHEGTLDNPEAATAAQPSHAPDDITRIGRRGICMLCGTLKSGSFVICEECGISSLCRMNRSQSR